MSVALDNLNSLADNEATTALRQCCGSRTWAQAMAAARPFSGTPQVHLTADDFLDELQPDDWLEAFATHPRIGESAAGTASDNRSDRSADERAGLDSADQADRARLAEANSEYFDQFGYIFLISAAGKSAAEMLTALERRVRHAPELELEVAAAQQRLLTHLRLDKLLGL